jgi:acyl-CoA synthetase (AMP-forming)/AMP-acid ligase II
MSRPEPYSACWTLADHVDRAAAHWPEADALVFNGVRRTFEQFADATFEFARALAALGVRTGDAVGVLLPIGIPALTALYGAARLGAIGVPLDPGLRSAQLRDVTRHAGLTVLIAGPDVKRPDAPELEHFIQPGTELRALASQIPGAVVRKAQRAVALSDTAIIMYAPADSLRGCRLSNEGLIRSARILAEQRFPLEAGDRLFNPLPLAGLGALQPFNGCLAVGATYFGMSHFDAVAAAGIIAEERCTAAFPAIDALWAAILDELEGRDRSELWLVAVDGSPDLLKATAERVPEVTQVSMYGSTEAGGLITLGQLDDSHELRLSSVGRPFHGISVKILDLETGEELPAGRRGRIAVKGWSMFQGYHRDSTSHLDEDGYLHTSDVGSLDATGRLFLGDVTFVS